MLSGTEDQYRLRASGQSATTLARQCSVANWVKTTPNEKKRSISMAMVQKRDPMVLMIDNMRTLRASTCRKSRITRMPRSARTKRMERKSSSSPPPMEDDRIWAMSSRIASPTEIATTPKSKAFHILSGPHQKSRHPWAISFRMISRTNTAAKIALTMPNQAGIFSKLVVAARSTSTPRRITFTSIKSVIRGANIGEKTRVSMQDWASAPCFCCVVNLLSRKRLSVLLAFFFISLVGSLMKSVSDPMENLEMALATLATENRRDRARRWLGDVSFEGSRPGRGSDVSFDNSRPGWEILSGTLLKSPWILSLNGFASRGVPASWLDVVLSLARVWSFSTRTLSAFSFAFSLGASFSFMAWRSCECCMRRKSRSSWCNSGPDTHKKPIFGRLKSQILFRKKRNMAGSRNWKKRNRAWSFANLFQSKVKRSALLASKKKGGPATSAALVKSMVWEVAFLSDTKPILNKDARSAEAAEALSFSENWCMVDKCQTSCKLQSIKKIRKETGSGTSCSKLWCCYINHPTSAKMFFSSRINHGI